MQETLTSNSKLYKFYRIKKESKLKFMFILSCAFICILFLVTIIITIYDDKNNYFNKKTYYLLSLINTTDYKQALLFKEEIEKISGAGYIYKTNNKYYILAFGYLNENNAKKIIDSLRERYQNSSIIKVSEMKIKNSIRRELNKNLKVLNLYKALTQLSEKIYNICMDYEKNKDASSIYKLLQKEKLNILNLDFENVNLDSKIINVLQLSKEMILSYLEECSAEIYKNKDVLKNLRNLFIKLCLEDVDLRSQLNDM